MESELNLARTLQSQMQSVEDETTLGSEISSTEQDLNSIVDSFTSEEVSMLSHLTSIDSDGDGLSNTEEGWWCTDPENPNSDADAEGYTDGEEV